MLGACFLGAESVATCEVPDPGLLVDQDAIVSVRLAGLCGSDLHLYHGRESGADIGVVMGHEFVGEIVEVGAGVRDFRVGDSVCCPFSTNCGHCFYCRQGLTSRCEYGQLFGWRQDRTGLHGGQAQYVRVPWADASLLRIPAGVSDEHALLLGDNLSTAHFCADMAAVQPDGVYAVIGLGAVGLLCLQECLRRGARVAAIDLEPTRLEAAAALGADFTGQGEAAREWLADSSSGRGADAVLELVGLPAAQKLAYDLVRPGGVLSVIGCHCAPHFAFSPTQAYDKNLTYRTGRCPARHYMDRLGPWLADGSLSPARVITHRFGLQSASEAYDVFAGRKDGCLKAVLTMDD